MAQVPVPTYIFRGHTSAIHVLHICHHNEFLVSGDSDGWIVVWSLVSKRPVAVWKGHEGGIMGLRHWGVRGRLISHGRDHKLRVWLLDLRGEGLEGMSVRLPADGADAGEVKVPWLLHSLAVNALNYCAFSVCGGDKMGGEVSDESRGFRGSDDGESTLLLAAPNGLDAGGVDIFHLPSEHRVCQLPSDKEVQTGMVMALSLFRQSTTRRLVLASGYETGHVLLHVEKGVTEQDWQWTKAMVCQPHSQPVLSLDVTLDGEYVISSSADAVVAKFGVESKKLEKKMDTKHAGQQDLKIRDDGKILATAGWDKRVRVYSVKTLKELAVLKWHQEGCYATAFATTANPGHKQSSNPAGNDLIKAAVDILKSEQAGKAQNIHWLAAGGKDGKISLWDIY